MGEGRSELGRDGEGYGGMRCQQSKGCVFPFMQFVQGLDIRTYPSCVVSELKSNIR